MENIHKIEELKKKIEREEKSETPNQKQIQKWVERIAFLGIGLDMNYFIQKPYTNV